MELPVDVQKSLLSMGFSLSVDQTKTLPLTGGVASDIWCVQLEDRMVCVKKALAQLKVAQEWNVSVDRNAYEVDWFKTVAKYIPYAVPTILGHDPQVGIFVMDFLPPELYQVWKKTLSMGNADPTTAKAMADILVTIHSSTALDKQVAEDFATDELFFSLRPEPYLLATAKKHPDVASRLRALADITMANKKALVHGDVSPKNILVGINGPILIDAECAWYGDPAFDLAFCLNHLLLKCLWNRAICRDYLELFDVMVDTYLSRVDWEAKTEIEKRVAHLLPGLLLGRVDGKSPAEYITEDADKNLIRQFSKQFLTTPVDKLQTISSQWGIFIKASSQLRN